MQIKLNLLIKKHRILKKSLDISYMIKIYKIL